MDGYYTGLDISSLQGSITDFSVLKADFIIHRAFVGNDYADSNYNGSAAAIRAAGIPFAAYNFAYPIGLKDDPPNINRAAPEQAKLHFDFMGGNTFNWLDAEWPFPSQFAQFGCSAFQIIGWLLEYLETWDQLAGPGKIGIYTMPWWGSKVINMGSCPEFAKYPLWIANYTQTPMTIAPWATWSIWQTSGSAYRLPNGIVCDTDVAKDLSLFI